MKVKFYLGLILLSPLWAQAITMPAPPPELSDTLTKFRTQEQLNEDKVTDNKALNSLFEEVNVESAPFMPGDDVSGILRIAFTYSNKATIGVPAFGSSILRFYDLQGIPYEIASIKCENQGFEAQITASPFELLVKPRFGASTTHMVVTLTNYDRPLIFTLTKVKLTRAEVLVNTIISTIKVHSFTSATGYIYPKLKEFAKPNPKAEPIEFSKDSLIGIENALIDAARVLKQNAQD